MPKGVHTGHLSGPRCAAYRHGATGTRLFNAWRNMRTRCMHPRHADNYAKRGITICARWSEFANFAADMGPHPGNGWTLDRRDNDLGYSKGNCRWATRTQQANNRRVAKQRRT